MEDGRPGADPHLPPLLDPGQDFGPGLDQLPFLALSTTRSSHLPPDPRSSALPVYNPRLIQDLVRLFTLNPSLASFFRFWLNKNYNENASTHQGSQGYYPQNGNSHAGASLNQWNYFTLMPHYQHPTTLNPAGPAMQVPIFKPPNSSQQNVSDHTQDLLSRHGPVENLQTWLPPSDECRHRKSLCLKIF